MKLESKINFRVGQRVMFNPDNHRYEHLGSYAKVKDRLGWVKSVEQESRKLPGGLVDFKPTGRISVLWDGDDKSSIVNYSRLLIWDSELYSW